MSVVCHCVYWGKIFNREENYGTFTKLNSIPCYNYNKSTLAVSEKPSASLKQITGSWITGSKLRCRRPCFQHGLWRPRRQRVHTFREASAPQHRGSGEGITLPWNLWPGELYHPHVSEAAGCSQASLDQEDLSVYLRHKETQSGFQHLMYSMIMLYFCPFHIYRDVLEEKLWLDSANKSLNTTHSHLSAMRCAHSHVYSLRQDDIQTHIPRDSMLTLAPLPNKVNLVFGISSRHSEL